MWRFQWFFNAFIHCHCTLLMFIEPFFSYYCQFTVHFDRILCVSVRRASTSLRIQPRIQHTHTHGLDSKAKQQNHHSIYIHIYIWSEWRIIHQRRFNYKSEEIHPLNGALNHFVRTNQHFILALSLQRQQSAITNRNAFATVGMLLPLLLVLELWWWWCCCTMNISRQRIDRYIKI